MSERALRFRSTVHLSGKTATGIRVPDSVVEGLASGKRPPVRVTIGDYTYRSTIAPMGGEFWIPLSAEHREGAGLTAGDEVKVAVELDLAPREVVVPQDFAQALDDAPEARRFFDGLSYSNKRWHVLSIEGAKKPETRQRRIASSVAMLREGRAR